MAIAVASAATTTDVRESDAVKLRPASKLSARRRVRARVDQWTASTTAGQARAAAAIAKIAATYPPTG
jgi:hypothetical protein